MSNVTPVEITADGVAKVFGVRHPKGTTVTVFEVDGFNFPTREAADLFDASPWPRTLHDGRVVTSDRVAFPASKAAMAAARQARLEGESA